MFNLRTFSIHALEAPEGSEPGSEKLAYADTGLVIAGSTEVAPAEFAALSDGEYGKVFRFFSDDVASSLAIGMRLTGGGDTFDVKGVTRQGDGPFRRLEATLVLAPAQ
jgi:hypothetical protein